MTINNSIYIGVKTDDRNGFDLKMVFFFLGDFIDKTRNDILIRHVIMYNDIFWQGFNDFFVFLKGFFGFNLKKWHEIAFKVTCRSNVDNIASSFAANGSVIASFGGAINVSFGKLPDIETGFKIIEIFWRDNVLEEFNYVVFIRMLFEFFVVLDFLV